jgi:sec-independent protein translocase protein TatC
MSLSRRASLEDRMLLLEHIRELSNRVIKAAIAVTAGSIVGWCVYPWVWNFIRRQYCQAQISSPVASAIYRSAGTLGPQCTLHVTAVFDALFLRMQIAIATGVIISLPIWLYQLWAFMAPGLHKRERRWAYYFVGAAVPLFGVGATIAYFAMTRGLEFLVHYMIPADVTVLITINTYLSFVGAMLLIFGIAFELSLVLVLLNLAGVLTHVRFRKWRRVIIFLVFAFSALFTPSLAPQSMLLLAVRCVVLTEAAEAFVWANDRRCSRHRSREFSGLSEAEVGRVRAGQAVEEQVSATEKGGVQQISGNESWTRDG